MPKVIDLIGQKFGRLEVIQRVDNNKWGSSRWLCNCDCGQETITLGNGLLSGNTQSCGCFQKEKTIKRMTKHGNRIRGRTTPTYVSWRTMNQRCTNPNSKRWKDYGGRGITVCNRWRKFENFLEDMGERPNLRYSIERKKNDLGYYKKNCCWATRKQQQRNMRNNRLITYNGKTQLLIELAEEYGINYSTLYYRMYRLGWSTEKALTEPIKKRKEQKNV